MNDGYWPARQKKLAGNATYPIQPLSELSQHSAGWMAMTITAALTAAAGLTNLATLAHPTNLANLARLANLVDLA
jgi:hypothetical protein